VLDDSCACALPVKIGARTIIVAVIAIIAKFLVVIVPLSVVERPSS